MTNVCVGLDSVPEKPELGFWGGEGGTPAYPVVPLGMAPQASPHSVQNRPSGFLLYSGSCLNLVSFFYFKM